MSCNLQAFFLPGVAGKLFAVYIPPNRDRDAGENVLVVPPFAEEMTRVRRMVNLQARRLSSIGVGTLIVDLYGTGDSEGEFRDARWDVWRSDVGTAFDWLGLNCGGKVSLLGIRLGALLALDFAQQANVTDVDKTVLWKPVVSGKENLREFLLIRVLAGMMQKAMSRVTLESLRTALQNGELVEAAGYELTSTLADEIGRLELGPLAIARSSPIHWVELTATPDDARSVLVEEVINDWNEHDILTSLYPVSGFPFWAEWDVRVVSELLDVTTRIFGDT
jgi:exosortase A-associated hydrolase 2